MIANGNLLENSKFWEVAQGARNAETKMYMKYMRILSPAQRRDIPKT